MKIKNIISIGTCCTSLFVTKNLGIRTPGPVDNMSGYNIASTLKLLNGDLYKSIINKEYSYEENYWGDFDRCMFDGFDMRHNDFHLEKTKKELFRRFENLNKYLECAKNNKEMFFILSYGYDDKDLTQTLANYVTNQLPEYIKKRLITALEVDDIDAIKGKYLNIGYYDKYCIDSNTLRLNINFKEHFNNWWGKNKIYYEEINKCKYDLV